MTTYAVWHGGAPSSQQNEIQRSATRTDNAHLLLRSSSKHVRRPGSELVLLQGAGPKCFGQGRPVISVSFGLAAAPATARFRFDVLLATPAAATPAAVANLIAPALLLLAVGGVRFHLDAFHRDVGLTLPAQRAGPIRGVQQEEGPRPLLDVFLL